MPHLDRATELHAIAAYIEHPGVTRCSPGYALGVTRVLTRHEERERLDTFTVKRETGAEKLARIRAILKRAFGWG